MGLDWRWPSKARAQYPHRLAQAYERPPEDLSYIVRWWSIPIPSEGWEYLV